MNASTYTLVISNYFLSNLIVAGPYDISEKRPGQSHHEALRANGFAKMLAEIQAHLMFHGEYDQVWRPQDQWVAAIKYLPRSAPDPAPARARGLAFAEGRDAVFNGSQTNLPDRVASVTDLADHHPDRLDSLPGDFGFIRFRPHGQATIVRSAAGLVPFYIRHDQQRTAIGTQLGAFVKYLPDEPVLDRLVNAAWTSGHGFFPDGRTFLEGIQILDAGAYATVNSAGLTKAKYWNPRVEVLKRPTQTQAQEHIDRFRTILLSSLERDLDPETGNLLTLSGGVDSSSLGALAGKTHKVWTWSLVPPGGPILERELSFINPLVKEFGFERSWFIDPGRRTIFDLLEAAPEVVCHVIHPALCSLPKIKAEADVRVLFGGEFADEVCGSKFTIPDWAVETSLLRLLLDLKKLPFGQRDILRWIKHRWLRLIQRPMLPFASELPDFIAQDLRDEHREWFLSNRRQAASDRSSRNYIQLCLQDAGWVVMNWEATSALGVRRAFPFLSREMLELAFSLHPTELLGPGTKKLLRASALGLVPERSLERSDKGQFGPPLPRSLPAREVPDTLNGIVTGGWDPYGAPDNYEVLKLVQLRKFFDSLARHRAFWARPAESELSSQSHAL